MDTLVYEMSDEQLAIAARLYRERQAAGNGSVSGSRNTASTAMMEQNTTTNAPHQMEVYTRASSNDSRLSDDSGLVVQASVVGRDALAAIEERARIAGETKHCHLRNEDGTWKSTKMINTLKHELFPTHKFVKDGEDAFGTPFCLRSFKCLGIDPDARLWEKAPWENSSNRGSSKMKGIKAMTMRAISNKRSTDNARVKEKFVGK